MAPVTVPWIWACRMSNATRSPSRLLVASSRSCVACSSSSLPDSCSCTDASPDTWTASTSTPL
eukprot:951795-Rhodomonas_salina.1